MPMQALFTTGKPDAPLTWRETPTPDIDQATDAIVRPLAVAACDLDKSIVSGRSPFAAPFMLGHEFTGVVLKAGEGVSRIAAGDLVLASFQPSCGTCPRCETAMTSVCESVPNGTMYGIGPTGGDWGGALAEAIRVPWADNNLAPLPRGMDYAPIASASDNLADGLRCVDKPLSSRPDSSVLIAGRGSIPLYATVCAQFLGAGEITVASDDPFVLQTAHALGVECLEVGRWPKRFASHEITVDCTNDVDGLAAVLRSTAPYGTCTSASIFFGGDIPVPVFNMNMRGITFHTGRVNSAGAIPRVLALLENGLDPERINPAYHAFDDAIDALITEPFSRKVIVRRGIT